MNNNELKMQSPWVCYVNEIRELFKPDKEIKMTWDDDTLELKMYVENPIKAAAIMEILPTEKAFDKNVVKIEVIPSNGNAKYLPKAVATAFENNPIFNRVETMASQFISNPITYAIFNKLVIQYFNDNLGDIHGNRSCLAEDLARNVLETEGILYCTDIEDPVYK